MENLQTVPGLGYLEAPGKNNIQSSMVVGCIEAILISGRYVHTSIKKSSARVSLCVWGLRFLVSTGGGISRIQLGARIHSKVLVGLSEHIRACYF